jgi:F-type H+-transporting ATPase subunit a
MSSLHISVAAEKIAQVGPISITNSLLTSFITMALLLGLAFKVNSEKGQEHKSKITSLIEWTVETLYTYVRGIAGDKTDMLFPFLFTFFIFIILANWIGLLPVIGSIGFHEVSHGKEVFVPIFRGPNADLSTTFALALISVITTNFLSIKALGIKAYIGRFINIKNPMDFVVGILEIVSELSKIISFSFRLFGNIFAGEVLIAVMTFLVPVIVPIPFIGLEVFVGFIQAFVFTMLTLIFIVLATEPHHENHSRR